MNKGLDLPPNGGVEKVRFYPQTPQGGLYNLLDFNKSPLGDLGVNMRRLALSTVPFRGEKIRGLWRG